MKLLKLLKIESVKGENKIIIIMALIVAVAYTTFFKQMSEKAEIHYKI